MPGLFFEGALGVLSYDSTRQVWLHMFLCSWAAPFRGGLPLRELPRFEYTRLPLRRRPRAGQSLQDTGVPVAPPWRAQLVFELHFCRVQLGVLPRCCQRMRAGFQFNFRFKCDCESRHPPHREGSHGLRGWIPCVSALERSHGLRFLTFNTFKDILNGFVSSYRIWPGGRKSHHSDGAV